MVQYHQTIQFFVPLDTKYAILLEHNELRINSYRLQILRNSPARIIEEIMTQRRMTTLMDENEGNRVIQNQGSHKGRSTTGRRIWYSTEKHQKYPNSS